MTGMAGALMLFASPAGAATARSAADCGRLAGLKLPDVQITGAQVVAAGAYRPASTSLARMMGTPGMNVAGQIADVPNPAFCQISLTLRPSADSDIRTQVWLPLAGWNGKYLGVGNFGWAGALMTGGMSSGLSEGYVTASNDTGHDSTTPEGKGGQFTLGHPDKTVDYAWRADHLMTVDAKVLIRAFYGKGPVHSYWIGCSLGGLEGLIEVKRFPQDYDGIVAGAPPNPIVNFNAEQLWGGWLVNRNPAYAIPREKFAMVTRAMIEHCATPVGKAQGFIEEPDRCGLTPRDLQCKGDDAADCLTPGQVELFDKLYQGPVNPRTGQLIFPGQAKGSEEGMSGASDGKPFPVALDIFRFTAFQKPDWDWTTLGWDADVAQAIARVGPLLHVDDDLRPFFRRGGKLLFYIGWNDGHNPEQLIDYYKRVMARAGDTGRGSARLFTIPGMGHCFGGAGCDTFNKLGMIDAWVDKAQAPERVVAARVEKGKVTRTRPLCAWPDVATYRGQGSISDAANFDCRTPGA